MAPLTATEGRSFLFEYYHVIITSRNLNDCTACSLVYKPGARRLQPPNGTLFRPSRLHPRRRRGSNDHLKALPPIPCSTDGHYRGTSDSARLRPQHHTHQGLSTSRCQRHAYHQAHQHVTTRNLTYTMNLPCPFEPRAQPHSRLPLRLSDKRLPINRKSHNARPLTHHPAVQLIQSPLLEPIRLDGSSRQVLRDGGIGTQVLPMMRCSHPGVLAGWVGIA